MCIYKHMYIHVLHALIDACRSCNYMCAMLESWQHPCSAGQGLYCLQQEGFQSGSCLLQESSENQPKLSRLVHAWHLLSISSLGSACEGVYCWRCVSWLLLCIPHSGLFSYDGNLRIFCIEEHHTKIKNTKYNNRYFVQKCALTKITRYTVCI